MPKPDGQAIRVRGRCDSFGDLRPNGAFLRVEYWGHEAASVIVLQEHEALELIADVAGALNRVNPKRK